MFITLFISSFFISAVSYTVIVQFLRKYLAKENFRGRKVPTGSGIVLLIAFIFTVSFYVFFVEQQIIVFRRWLIPLTILVTTMGILGFIDDVFGSRKVGGFRGHFRELIKGHVTTGIIKAIGGGIVCLIAAYFFSSNFLALIVNGLLMALLANIFNLLDLRPGRALKLFLILGIVIFLFSFKNSFWSLAGIFLGTYVILMWAELSESSMLGDVGSNVLGAVIGFSFVVNFSWVVNIVVLFLVGLVQIYAESHSITALIENTPVLRYFDKFGRRPEKKETLRKRQKVVMR